MRAAGWAWLGKAVLVALAGCSGGQTGDAGNGGGDCYEVGRETLSAAAAEESGYEVTAAITRLTAGREEGQSVWLTAPPSLWESRGESPPADRGVAAVLFVETTTMTEVRRECENEIPDYPYARTLEIGVSYRFEIPELAGVVAGEGQLGLYPDREDDLFAVATSIEGELPTEGACLLREATVGPQQALFECDGSSVWATAPCEDRMAVGPVPGSDRSVESLVSSMNDLSPLTLSCADGGTIDVELSVSTPRDYCPAVMIGGESPSIVPVVLSVRAPALELEGEFSYGAWLRAADGLQCWADCGSHSCVIPDTEDGPSPRCSEVFAHRHIVLRPPGTSPPTARDELIIEAKVQLDADGAATAGLGIRGWLDGDVECFASAALE